MQLFLAILFFSTSALADLEFKFRASLIPVARHYILGAKVDSGVYSAFSLIVVTPKNPGFLRAFPEFSPAKNLEWIQSGRQGVYRPDLEEEYVRMLQAVKTPESSDVTEEFRREAIDRKVKEAHRYYKLAYDFAREIYLSSGNFEKTPGEKATELPPGIETDLQGILSGEQSLILVTEYLNPNRVLQTISVGYEGADGLLPLERRLLGKGLKEKLPRTPLRVGKGFRPYVDPLEPYRTYSAADDFLSSTPIVEGSPAEIKLYARNSSVKIPWGKVLRRLLIAHNHTRHSPFIGEGVRFIRDPNVQSAGFADFCRLREACLDANDNAMTRALHTAYFQTFFGDLVTPVWIDRLYIEAVNEQSARTYQGWFDVNEKIGEPFEDPEVFLRKKDGTRVKARTQILAVDRSYFDATALTQERWYQAGYPLAEIRIVANPYGSTDLNDPVCARLVGTHELLTDPLLEHYPTPF